jgi:hypothetical protein
MKMFLNNAVQITTGLWNMTFNSHQRSVDDIPSCDGGNINSYQWLNSCINVSNCWYNCLLPRNMDFIYFQAMGTEPPL